MKTDEVRHLLERYYDGTATVEETASLKRYFAETAADTLPADLRADASMFRAMARKEAPAVPAGLEQRILAATVGEKARQRRFSWKLTLSAAAAAAVLITLGVSLFTGSPDKAPQQQQFAALKEQPAEPAAPDTVAALTAEVASEPAKTVVAVEEKRAVSEPRIVAPERVVTEEFTVAARYREVTDSAEVVEITSVLLATIDATLEAGFGQAERGLRDTEAAIDIIRDPFSLIKTQ